MIYQASEIDADGDNGNVTKIIEHRNQELSDDPYEF